MERANIRGDFVERLSIFMDAYDRASTKEEKGYLAKEFFKHCTSQEIDLVREVIGDVLEKHNFNLPSKLFS